MANAFEGRVGGTPIIAEKSRCFGDHKRLLGQGSYLHRIAMTLTRMHAHHKPLPNGEKQCL